MGGRPPRLDPRLSPRDVRAIAKAVAPFDLLSVRLIDAVTVEVAARFYPGPWCGLGRIFHARRSVGGWVALDRGIWAPQATGWEAGPSGGPCR